MVVHDMKHWKYSAFVVLVDVEVTRGVGGGDFSFTLGLLNPAYTMAYACGLRNVT